MKINKNKKPILKLTTKEDITPSLQLTLSKEEVEQIKRTTGILSKSMEAFKRTATASLKEFAVFRKDQLRFNTHLAEKRARIQESHFQITETHKRQLADFQRTIELSRKFNKDLKKGLVLLGQAGWYLDFETTSAEMWDFVYALEAGDVIEAQTKLVGHYQSRIKDIFSYVLKAFPNRSVIFEQAFGAHNRGKYSLSVPVILAQSDGICKEITGLELFKKKRGQPVTASLLEPYRENELRAAILYPLSIVLPISTSKSSSDKLVTHLNRHEVLHGLSVDYGTEINSLKAISLLYYIVRVLSPQT